MFPSGGVFRFSPCWLPDELAEEELEAEGPGIGDCLFKVFLLEVVLTGAFPLED